MGKFIIDYKRIFLLMTLFFFYYGISSLNNMPKSEDPVIPEVSGMVLAIYPGATSNEVREYIAKPIEDELAKVEDIEEYNTTVRSETVVITVKLDRYLNQDSIIKAGWDDVRRALERASKKFPSNVIGPVLNDNVAEKEAIVLALTSDLSLIKLKEISDDIKDRILRFDNVIDVLTNADPGEQISVSIKDEKVANLGLSYFQIVNQLSRSNQTISAGSIKVGDNKLSITTNTTFKSLEEIRQFPLSLKSDEVVKLGEIANIEKTLRLPKTQSMSLNGNQAIGLGVILKEEIDLVKYKDYFQEEFEKLKKDYPEVKFTVLSFFPDNVANRIQELGLSLFTGVASLGVVLMLLMGVRVGVLVSVLVPIISFIALGLFALSGGVLQQISIAAFVMALGLLVDNIIVISESIQNKMNSGLSNIEAAKETISEFALPLFAATGTTVAAFAPMLIAKGPAAEFTRDLAFVTLVTLSVSYLFSIFVTPVWAASFLKSRKEKKSKFIERIAVLITKCAKRKPLMVMGSIIVILLISVSYIPKLKFQFFPYADREQLVIDLRLPEGTDYSVTKKVSDSIVEGIKSSSLWEKEIQNIATYVGTSTPKFYYNLNLLPSSPHLSQMLVTIDSFKNSPRVRDEIDKIIQPIVNDGIAIVRELEQGPPVEAAVIVKIFGNDMEEQIKVSEEIRTYLTSFKEASGVRTQIGPGSTEIKFNLNDTNSLKFGVARSEVTSVILGRTRGVPSSKFRVDDNPVDIIIKSSEGDSIALESLKKSAIVQTRNDVLTLENLGSEVLVSNPSVITHENGKQLVKVYAELAKGYGYNEILAKLKPYLSKMKLPQNITIELGGQDAESKKSNQELVKGGPVALALLILFLLIQFNSFKKSLIVFASVPLSFAGISPSHLLNGFPFGFFSLLGALALIGIIVNNAILIIEFIDAKVAETGDLELSILESLRMRLKPILFTTTTTIIGLLPLALGDATLWPPFAWTIIYGLILGSLLTVFFVPSFYYVLYKNKSFRINSNLGTASFVLFLLVLFPDLSYGKVVSLEEVLSKSEKSNEFFQIKEDREILKNNYKTQWRSAFIPKIALKAEEFRLNEDLVLQIPSGNNLTFQGKSSFRGQAVISQNIFDMPEMFGKPKAMKNQLESSKLMEKRGLEVARYKAAIIYLSNVELNIKIDSLRELIKNLEKRRVEVKRLYNLGRVSEVDALKIVTKLDDAKQSLSELNSIKPSLEYNLAKIIGEDERVEVQDIHKLRNIVSKLRKENLMSDKISRKDLQAMDFQIKAQEKIIESINQEYLPKITLEGSVFSRSPSPFQDETWSTVAVVAKWSIFAGATRQSRKAAERTKSIKIQRERLELKRSINAEISRFKGLLKSKQEEIDTRQLNFQRAVKFTKIEAIRYKRGKSTLNDILDAEDLLKNLREKKDLVFLEYLKSYFDLKYVLGETIQI